MSVTAESLKAGGAACAGLKRYVTDIVNDIDNKLRTKSSTWGKNILCYELPTTFTVVSLRREDAQRVVYGSVIASLENRGFDVGITINVDKCLLYVRWSIDLARSEADKFTALIRKHILVGHGAIDRFVESAGAPEQPPAEDEEDCEEK